MRVLITTGIFEPDSGGPATYTPVLAEALTKVGWSVTVITFSARRRYESDKRYSFRLVRVKRGKSRLLNRVKLLFAAVRYVWRSDIVYTLDWFAVGLPVSLLAKIFGKRYIVRVGGDYVWEKHMEAGKMPVTLDDFYSQGVVMQKEYRAYYGFISAVLLRAKHIIFNTDTQRAQYVKYYELPEERTSVIYNPVPRSTVTAKRDAADAEFVYWGRLTSAKNIDSLIEAFAKAKLPASYRLAIIGDGPQKEELIELARSLGLQGRVSFTASMAQRDVFERVRNSRAFVLPSWTDISPNSVYECLALGLPALVTTENYLSVRDQLPAMIDPRSVDDIAAKLEMLADDTKYAEFSRAFSGIRFDHSWDDVVRQHKEIFEKV